MTGILKREKQESKLASLLKKVIIYLRDNLCQVINRMRIKKNRERRRLEEEKKKRRREGEKKRKKM